MPVAQMLMSSMGGSSSGGSGGGGGGVGQAVANTYSGLLSGVTGFFQRRKAKKMLGGLTRPNYEIPQDVLKNQKMAELAANEGMSAQQYTNAQNDIQRNQTSVLNSSLDRRSALMALPKIQQQSNDATGKLNVQDDMMRKQNQRVLYGINSQVGQYRDKAWDINKMQPYQRDYEYAMGLLGAGNQNMMAGLDRMITGGGQFLGSGGGGSAGGGSKKKVGDVNDLNYYDGYGGNGQYSNVG